MNADHYDALETRPPAARDAAQFEALRDHLHVAMRAPAIARLLEGVDPDAVTDRSALAALPVIRKSELMALQAEAPPLGGLVPGSVEDYANVFASPGPIFEPAPRQTDPFRLARALFAAGLRKGDLVHNTFSYHFTPAGAMLEGGGACHRVHRVPCRDRADRAPGAGNRASSPERLRGHALVPQHPPRQGGRARRERELD